MNEISFSRMDIIHVNEISFVKMDIIYHKIINNVAKIK